MHLNRYGVQCNENNLYEKDQLDLKEIYFNMYTINCNEYIFMALLYKCIM